MAVINNRIVRDLNHGSVTVTMLLFALPLLGASLVQMFYNTADMIIVGQFVGRNGLGSVSIGGDILHFIAFVSMGFSSAGQVIISQFIGAGLKEKIGRIIGTMFSFLFIINNINTQFIIYKKIFIFNHSHLKQKHCTIYYGKDKYQPKI